MNPDNAAGRALMDMITPNLQQFLVNRLRVQSGISATQALIAVRAAEIKTGALPRDLGSLVPTFLPQVPRDYFDGAPIRYSPELRTIWSVGQNALTITSADGATSPREVVLRIPQRSP